jgi:hypothetical protein
MKPLFALSILPDHVCDTRHRPLTRHAMCSDGCGSLNGANQFLLVLPETANSDTRMSISSVQYTTAQHTAHSTERSAQ